MDVNPPEDISTLGRVALTDPDPQRRAQAGVLLAATENPSVVPLLHQALSDKDPEVRHTLVKEIADLDFAPDTTIDLLTPVAMKDAEARNRVAALETLAAIGGDRVLTLATRLRKDPDQDIRVLAEKILHGAASGPE
jgi:HEAT repeat protein